MAQRVKPFGKLCTYNSYPLVLDQEQQLKGRIAQAANDGKPKAAEIDKLVTLLGTCGALDEKASLEIRRTYAP